jgi:hypothetical protein
MKIVDAVVVLLFVATIVGLAYGSWLLGGVIERSGPAWSGRVAIAVLYFGLAHDVITKIIEHYTR